MTEEIKPGSLVVSRYPRISVLYKEFGIEFQSRKWKDLSSEDIALFLFHTHHDTIAFNSLILIGGEVFWAQPKDLELFVP